MLIQNLFTSYIASLGLVGQICALTTGPTIKMEIAIGSP